MRFTHYLYIIPLSLLAACNSSEELTNNTADHPNGPIQLSAGIVEGGSASVTRAGAEDNHTNHTNLASDTKIRLRVSGTWTGHDPVNVVKEPTATIGEATGMGDLHNKITCDPVLYWDDYGTANPDNTANRAAGLTIYGIALQGVTTAPEAPENWTAMDWTLLGDQSSGINTGDLLISNNVQAAPGASTSNDGTYKFSERGSGKLLEFRHALSKITVNLRAGKGFNSSFTSTEVSLTSNLAGASTNTEWPLTTGKVDITTGSISLQGTPSVITMADAATITTGWTATKEAIVMPGSTFRSSNTDVIARINADGNIYYVTAEKIRAKMSELDNSTDYKTKPGTNYIINVIVDKTEIEVTATITNWTTVTADPVTPEINVSADWGTGTTELATSETFSLYRSTSMNEGYNTSAVENGYYPEESFVCYSSSKWTMSPQLYWPNHNTHYQFRGVWPRTVITAGDNVTSPRVEIPSGASYQAIKVKNVEYSTGTFPSDLMIARPEFVDPTNATCSNTETGHTTTNLYNGGICATEGTIKLNFRYMMSQVEVHLTSKTSNPSEKVDLSNVKLEIVNIYSYGNVKLGDRETITTGTNTDAYELSTRTLDTTTDPGTDIYKYDSHAIVPQTLTYSTPQAEGNVKFRITVTNTNGTSDTSDDTQDVYYADINPIKVSGGDALVAPKGKWESGVHYVYNLNLKKTEVKVTATLTDWKKVTANEEVWF